MSTSVSSFCTCSWHPAALGICLASDCPGHLYRDEHAVCAKEVMGGCGSWVPRVTQVTPALPQGEPITCGCAVRRGRGFQALITGVRRRWGYGVSIALILQSGPPEPATGQGSKSFLVAVPQPRTHPSPHVPLWCPSVPFASSFTGSVQMGKEGSAERWELPQQTREPQVHSSPSQARGSTCGC